VTRRGRYAAAQVVRDGAETSLASLNGQLTPLLAIAGLEQLGLGELNAALGATVARETSKQVDKDNAEADYSTAYADAATGFVSSNVDPATLTAGDAVVAPISSPSVNIDADAVAGGVTWTQAQIDGLAADMDAFIAGYTWPDAQGQTVEQLEVALADAAAQLGAVQQQVAEATGDRDAQQGVADVAAGAAAAKQGEVSAKQIELDTASDALDVLLGQQLTGVNATHVSGNVWEADVSGLEDGTLAIQAVVTDAAGNSASTGASFTLDTSADLDEAFAVSVSTDDVVTNLAESTDVSLTLSGIDADASSVSVEITDGTNTVNADATNDGAAGWLPTKT